MPAKLTTSDFISRAKAVHGDRYGYEFVDYTGMHRKVIIFCQKHGSFIQTLDIHINNKSGCPKCKFEKIAIDRKLSNSDFIEKANKVHGNKYDYSLTEHKNTESKIKVVCHDHGVFTQTSGSHLQGCGCPKCSHEQNGVKCRITSKDFITRSINIHGKRYDYSLVKYVNTVTKVKIVCYEHGSFTQTPNSHLNGRGCPGCMSCGFDKTKKGFLYVLRSECGRYMKIGITNKPDQRHAQLSRATPFPFERIELIEGQGDHIADLEKELLSCYNHAEFTETFDGYTEWRLFDDSIRHKLLTSKIQG